MPVGGASCQDDRPIPVTGVNRFDVVQTVESLEHMPDLPTFFRSVLDD